MFAFANIVKLAKQISAFLRHTETFKESTTALRQKKKRKIADIEAGTLMKMKRLTDYFEKMKRNAIFSFE